MKKGLTLILRNGQNFPSLNNPIIPFDMLSIKFDMLSLYFDMLRPYLDM
ncbi:hypothetical protein KCTC52924_03593 [Arenibacter antarcticus]